ncbi:MOB kinase activator 2-like [Saccoglossus kowalevskii]|uniref:MOB kinase activator 2-like n=1 Tax=Saccoglossus kowalevskii TaxID=10224 RepID=A0ABM0M6W7_SACKO|nr:PREDICTED: MOB kinase activator 2-like [Saccoglossus kowalevskii]
MDWLMGKAKKREKPPVEEKKLYLEPKYANIKLDNLDFCETVKLPDGICINEWLATFAIAFFNNINLQYGCISEFCTQTLCSTMSAPNSTTYTWVDEKGKKSKCTAAQYVDYVMTSLQKYISDENVFPTKYDVVFPADFESIIQRIFRMLFHVMAHIYHAHFEHMVLLDNEADLHCLFTHFIYFSREFNLLDSKETVILDDLIELLGLNSQSKSKEESVTANATTAR